MVAMKTRITFDIGAALLLTACVKPIRMQAAMYK